MNAAPVRARTPRRAWTRVLFVGRAEGFLARFHREFEGDLQQGYELDGKCGLIEIVLSRFDLASTQEARDVDGCRLSLLHGFGVFPLTAHRADDRGEAVVKTARPAGHDSQGSAQSLYILCNYPRFVD